MKLNCKYIDHIIDIDDESINAIEIENKKYFYRFISDLCQIQGGNLLEDFYFFEGTDEVNMSHRVQVLADYFNLELNSKRNIVDMNKLALQLMDEMEKQELVKEYRKLIKIFGKSVNDLDLPITVQEEVDLEMLFKILKVEVESKKELLDQLLVLIDIESILHLNQLTILVNLKQYLTESELVELYKYSLYKKVTILLLDSQSYGRSLVYEKKLLIDENLVEFVL